MTACAHNAYNNVTGVFYVLMVVYDGELPFRSSSLLRFSNVETKIK
ncbi:hypothetical protein PC112_g21766 [Phytophthora cactorum]|uniref:Uncharacterized protein n=1 Tax=Phytophthora cactorum TaxID=29920 RepID=A0A8T1AP69_9STRA|nr:hypothetical protein PC112_g21766 [Phytophthora cactorum]KAG2883830.1 hypothetical protein PC115_g21508 [Phytophthora cactorum]